MSGEGKRGFQKLVKNGRNLKSVGPLNRRRTKKIWMRSARKLRRKSVGRNRIWPKCASVGKFSILGGHGRVRSQRRRQKSLRRARQCRTPQRNNRRLKLRRQLRDTPNNWKRHRLENWLRCSVDWRPISSG